MSAGTQIFDERATIGEPTAYHAAEIADCKLAASLRLPHSDQLEARGMDVEIAGKSAVVYGSISTKGEDRKLQSAV